MFIETVRDPERFRSVLGAAAERDVPVVVLKVGREALTRQMVTAHSGALAGEDGTKAQLWVDGTKVKEETLSVAGNLAGNNSFTTTDKTQISFVGTVLSRVARPYLPHAVRATRGLSVRQRRPRPGDGGARRRAGRWWGPRRARFCPCLP